MSAQIKERPILFSGSMVRALLDGSKTQTRRALKVRCQEIGERDDGSRWPWSEHPDTAGDHWHACPYGQPCDRLWVRETWADLEQITDGSFARQAIYRADDIDRYGDEDEYVDVTAADMRWRPSIFMPRWANRILLEVAAVRVERLQDISEADARAEGVSPTADPAYFGVEEQHLGLNAREAYANLWDAINGAGSADANPWVWVVEFKRVVP